MTLQAVQLVNLNFRDIIALPFQKRNPFPAVFLKGKTGLPFPKARPSLLQIHKHL